MPNLVSEVMTSIDDTSAGMVTAIFDVLGANIFPFVRTMLIISMISFGISMMMGWIEYPVRQFAKRSFLIITVLTVAFNWVYFDLFIYTVFTDSPDELGGLMLGAIGAIPPGNISEQLGVLLHNGIIASGKAFASSGMFMPYILGALIFIAVLIVCAYAVALLALSKISMAVILALGPIFIVFLLFDSTKAMFSSWLQQLFNFAFITLLTYIVLAFFLTLINNTINIISPSPEVDDVVPLCVIGFIGTFVLMQIPGIASGLAGGVQIGTMGAMSALARGASRMNASVSRGVGGVGGGAGKLAGKGIKNIYDRIRNRNTIKRK